MGPISDEEKKQEILINNLYLRYQNAVDPDSAYEFFQRKAQQDELAAEKEKAEALLEEKMERWVYLNDLAEKIAAQG